MNAYEKALLVAAFLRNDQYLIESGTKIEKDAECLVHADLAYWQNRLFTLNSHGRNMARDLLIQVLASGFAKLDLY